MSATWRAITPTNRRASSLSQVWRDANLQWHMRETREGKIVGDIMDLGKGLALGGALYGANLGVANLRSGFSSWSVMGSYDPFSVATAEDLSGRSMAQHASLGWAWWPEPASAVEYEYTPGPRIEDLSRKIG